MKREALRAPRRSGTDHSWRAITSTRSMPNRHPRVHEQSSLRKAGDGGTESVGQLHDPPPKSHRGSVHAKTSGESRSQACRHRQAESGEEAEYLWDEDLSPEVYHSTSIDGKTNRLGFAKATYEPRIQSNNKSTRGCAERDGGVPGLQLQHKGDKPFRAPHILLIALAQLRLEDVLFYMDTVTHAKQRTSHNDEQTQPVRQAESQSE
jgi:hypothetical protein